MNMVEEQKSKLFYLGIYPNCPFFGSLQAILIILALIALGTVGISYLNIQVAVGYLLYSIVYYSFVMPLWLCKYCIFKVKETSIDRDTGETIVKLLSLDKWQESYCSKHIKHGKKWTWMMSIIWLLPIPLTVASLFYGFSNYALLSLIGFSVVLVGNFFYMLKKKCPSCPIQECCHGGF